MTPTPGRARVLVWLLVAAAYVVVGSRFPFVLLLGWWQALPVVALGLVLSDRAARAAAAHVAAGASGWPHPPLPVTAAALAAVCCVPWLVLGRLGADQAAHAYLTAVAAADPQLWDNFWYAGRYELVNYSPLFYPVAAVVGAVPLAVVSVAGAAAAFAHILQRLRIARAGVPALVFAGLSSVQILIGQYPFALGLALAVAAAAALRARRPLLTGIAALGCALASPLAFLFLVLVLLGVGISGGWWRSRWVALSGIAMAALIELAVQRAFPDGGRYPFSLVDLGLITGYTAVLLYLARSDPRLAPLRRVAFAYLAVTFAVFFFPGAVGSNVERFANYFAVPGALLVLGLRRYRPRFAAYGLLAAGVAVQLSPAVDALGRSLDDRGADRSFWAGGLHYLHDHPITGYRVEVVATASHWESDYLARASVPLARGWFRQDDYPLNALLLQPDITGPTYRRWLRSLGVRLVVRPFARLDSTAQAEARLLDGPGHAGLRLVYSDPDLRIYELPRPTPILTASSRRDQHRRPQLVSLTRNRLTLALPAAGSYRLRVRYTPYWDVDPPSLCLSADPSGLTAVRALRPGRYTLSFRLAAGTALLQLIGRRPHTSGPNACHH